MPILIERDVKELDLKLRFYPDMGLLAFRRHFKVLASDFLLAEEDLEIIALLDVAPRRLGEAAETGEGYQ
jgi:hypothetical protein